MSLVLINYQANEGATTTAVQNIEHTIATAFPSPGVTAGNIVVYLWSSSLDDNTQTPWTDTEVIDSLGNTYSGPLNLISTTPWQQGGGSQAQSIFVATGIAGGADTVTGTFSGSGDGADWLTNWIGQFGVSGSGTIQLVGTNGKAQNNIAAPATLTSGPVVFGANQVPGYLIGVCMNSGNANSTPTQGAHATANNVAGAAPIFTQNVWAFGGSTNQLGNPYTAQIAIWAITVAGTYQASFAAVSAASVDYNTSVVGIGQSGGAGGVNLAAAAADTTAAAANITAQALLVAAAQSATAAAATLINWATVTLASPLYVGVGGVLDPYANWSAGPPIVGSVLYYDPTFLSIATDGTFAGTQQNFTALVQFYNGTTFSKLLVTFTGGMVGYAADTTAATGVLAGAPLAGAATDTTVATGVINSASQLAANALSLTTAAGNLTARVVLASQAVDFEQASGLLKIAAALSAAATDVTTATGQFTTYAVLAANALDSTVATGGLASSGIAGAAVDTSTAAGALTVTVALAAAAQSVSSASAALTVQVALAGDAVNFTQSTGALTTQQPIFGAAVSPTVATGTLTVQELLAGAAQDLTIAGANLSTQSQFLGTGTDITSATGTLQPLAQYGSTSLEMLSLTGLQGAQSAYPQGSSAIGVAEYLDKNGIPFTPQSVQYRIDDLMSGANIVPWTAVTPVGTTNAITVTPAQNQMISTSLASEAHQLLLQINDGYGNPFYADVQFDIVRTTGAGP